MNGATMLASMGFALLVLWRLSTRGGTRNVLLLVAGFFVYFSFGPVVNVLLGNPVYEGTVLSEVGSASVGFALALAGIVAGDALAPQRRHFDDTTIRSRRRIYLILPLVYLGLAAYGLVIISLRGPSLVSATKDIQLATVGTLHYQYLLLQLLAVSTFYLSRQTALQRRLWLLNTLVYVSYSLLTSERDFLFVLAAVIMHREMLENRRRTLRVSLIGIGAVVVGAGLFALRSATGLGMASILNQGSILFIDSYLDRYVPSLFPHRWGSTYLESVQRMIPWVGDGVQPLSEWFARSYAPGGTSAYGFSLTGEAYLNFGLLGVPFVFFALTVAHRWIVNRADRSDWWVFFSTYTTAVWMYALRGDSSQIFASLLYGVLFFALLHVSSLRRGTAAAVRLVTSLREVVER